MVRELQLKMTADVKTFLLLNPNFAAVPGQKNNFTGHIQIDGSVYQIEFVAPKLPSATAIHCQVVNGISQISLNDFEPASHLTVVDYLVELREFLRARACSNRSRVTHITRHDITDFLDQLRTLIKSHRCSTQINRSYTQIKLTNFHEFPDHYLELQVADHGLEVSVRRHSLPDKDPSGHDLFSARGCLEMIVTKFCAALDEFTEFYYYLNTIDELCTVLEPVTVTTKHSWRIIRITDKLLAKIVINPLTPSAIVLNFIGPTVEVEKYRALYNENIHRWEADLDVYRNLLRIFDLMYFPTRCEKDEGVFCNICYMYTLDDHIPIISCENGSCGLIFHVACLKEWFATLADGKTFLAVSFGSCPSCKEKLSPSFVQLLDV